ncbi:MAG: hypothetical protein AAF620_08645 [Bacteroidota bacterium]
MKEIANNLLMSLFIWSFFACSSEDDITEDWIADNIVEPSDPGTPGSLDFSDYLAVGNSLTAGFADGALYREAQENNIANLLAGQFAQVDANVVFNQPDINSENGFHTSLNPSESGQIIGRTILDLSLLSPIPTDGEAIGAYSGDLSQLNNFGVPGLTLSDLEASGYGAPDTGNPFFTRIASDPATSSVLGDALAVDRSFFSFWLGSNDYLGYAVSGGQGDEPLTTYSASEFGADLGSALTQLTSDGTPGIVLDLPPTITLPFFQAISWDAIELDQATAETLDTNFEEVNLAIQATAIAGYTGDVNERLISYSAGANPILVHDEELDDLGSFFEALESADLISSEQRASLVPYEQSRPLVDGELVLLSASALLNTEADGDTTILDTPIGIVIPLGFSFTEASNGDQYFLNTAEQSAIVTARATYNGVISATVDGLSSAGADVALVSVQSTFVDALGLDEATAIALALPTESADGVSGIEIDGITLTPDFSPNGILSTDGIHPNPRGHGIITNLIIEVINERWEASVPTIDVLSLKGISFQP